MVVVRELLGQEDAPAEVALGALGRAGRFGLVLELDAVEVAFPGGVGPVDPQGVFAFAHGLLHDLDAVGLGRPFPLLRVPVSKSPRQMTSAETVVADRNEERQRASRQADGPCRFSLQPTGSRPVSVPVLVLNLSASMPSRWSMLT